MFHLASQMHPDGVRPDDRSVVPSTARFKLLKFNAMSTATSSTRYTSSHRASVQLALSKGELNHECKSDMFEVMLHEGYIGRCLDGSIADRLQPTFAHYTTMPHSLPFSRVRLHIETHAAAASYCGDCCKYTRQTSKTL